MEFPLIPAFIQFGPIAGWGVALLFAGLAAAAFKKLTNIEAKIDDVSTQNAQQVEELEAQKTGSERQFRFSMKVTIWVAAIGLVVTIAVALWTFLAGS